MNAPEPGHVEVLARRKDGTLLRWTARFIDAGVIADLGQLCILGEAWHREVTPPDLAAWENLRAGDPDPTWQMHRNDCGSEHGDLFCTREAGHHGQHIAGCGKGDRIAAVWTGEVGS